MMIKMSMLAGSLSMITHNPDVGGRDAHNTQETYHGSCISCLDLCCSWELRTDEEICAAPSSTQVNTDLEEHGGSTVGAISARRRD